MTTSLAASPNLDQIKKQAKNLLRDIRSAEPSGLDRLRANHPEFSSASPETALRAQLADAQLVIAREYGFLSWAKLKARVNDVSAELASLISAAIKAVNPVGWTEVEAEPNFPTRRARLEALLRAHPTLARMRVDSHGFTLLHRAAWGNSRTLADMLIDAGADIDARANDLSTPLTMALSCGHGQGNLAGMLAERTAVLVTLRVAAGLGLNDRVAGFIEGLPANAVDDQGSYYDDPKRDWDIVRDRDEILAEALTYAARNDQISTIEMLLDGGAPIDGEPYYGTALHWAAFFGKLSAVECLLQRGADRSKTDKRFGGAPSGWASQFQHEDVIEVLREKI